MPTMDDDRGEKKSPQPDPAPGQNDNGGEGGIDLSTEYLPNREQWAEEIKEARKGNLDGPPEPSLDDLRQPPPETWRPASQEPKTKEGDPRPAEPGRTGGPPSGPATFLGILRDSGVVFRSSVGYSKKFIGHPDVYVTESGQLVGPFWALQELQETNAKAKKLNLIEDDYENWEANHILFKEHVNLLGAQARFTHEKEQLCHLVPPLADSQYVSDVVKRVLDDEEGLEPNEIPTVGQLIKAYLQGYYCKHQTERQGFGDYCGGEQDVVARELMAIFLTALCQARLGTRNQKWIERYKSLMHKVAISLDPSLAGVPFPTGSGTPTPVLAAPPSSAGQAVASAGAGDAAVPKDDGPTLPFPPRPGTSPRPAAELSRARSLSPEEVFAQSLAGPPLVGGFLLGAPHKDSGMRCLSAEFTGSPGTVTFQLSLEQGGSAQVCRYTAPLADMWAACHVIRPAPWMSLLTGVGDCECHLVDGVNGDVPRPDVTTCHPALAMNALGRFQSKWNEKASSTSSSSISNTSQPRSSGTTCRPAFMLRAACCWSGGDGSRLLRIRGYRPVVPDFAQAQHHQALLDSFAERSSSSGPGTIDLEGHLGRATGQAGISSFEYDQGRELARMRRRCLWFC